MIGLLCFVVAVLAHHSSRRSGLRLRMPRSDISWCLAARAEGPGASHEQRPLVLRSALSLVPVNPPGSHDCSTRNAGTLASGRLSPLLALEITSPGRATADRGGIARADPADEHGEFALGCAAHPGRTAQARV